MNTNIFAVLVAAYLLMGSFTGGVVQARAQNEAELERQQEMMGAALFWPVYWMARMGINTEDKS